jgi:hypothetical protein
MKLQTNVGRSDEFGSLTRAYKGEEPVSIQEIKKEVIKAMEAAIEVMQSKLDALSKILSNALLALMDKANN